MKTCIIYHSETGNTRRVAEYIASACSAKLLIEVLDRADYSRLTRFVSQCSKARMEKTTPISPSTIDVSTFDLLILGSPVWAFRPTPVLHAAVNALTNGSGKPVIGFFTHGGMPGKTEEIFTRWCEDRWLRVVGTLAIHMNEIENGKKTKELAALISATGIP